MKDIKLIISGDSRGGEAAIRSLQRTGSQAASILEREFDQLGIKSSLAFENKRKAATSAYEKIKASGIATRDELARVERAHTAEMVRLDEEQYGKRVGLMQKFKANWLGITATVGAAVVALQKGFDLADQAAKGLQQRGSFAQLAASKGGNADSIIAELKRVSAETIATQVLVEKAGTAMLLGIEQKHLPKLMEIARASSRITGQTTTQAFEDLSLAVARGSKMILDNLGIMVNVEQANKDYAASVGKTVEQLTDADRKQAFLNATLAEGANIVASVGVESVTTAERMQQLAATMSNAKEIVGRGVLSVFLLLQSALQYVASFALGAAGGMLKMAAAAENMWGDPAAAKGMRLDAEAAIAAGADLFDKAGDSATGSWDVLTGKVAEVNQKLAELQKKNAAAKAEQDRKDQAEKNGLEERLKANKDFAKEMIKGEADRYKVLADMEKNHVKFFKDQIDEQKKKLEDFRQYRLTLRATMNAEDAQIAAIQSPQEALDPYSARLNTIDRLTAKEREIDKISDPEGKAKAYAALRTEWASIATAVEQDNVTLISKEQAVYDVKTAQERLREKVEESSRQEIDGINEQKRQLEDKWAAASDSLEKYQRKVSFYEEMLSRINGKDIVVNFRATGIEQISKFMGMAIQDENPKTSYGDYYTQGGATYWNDGTLADTGTSFVDLSGERANGGPVKANGTYLVGERGPEILRMGNQGGTVIPNDKIGGNSVTIAAGAVTVVLPTGTPEANIREFGRLLVPELKRLGLRMA